MNINDYKISFIQTGPNSFNAEVIEPSGTKFVNIGIRAHPSQINNESIFNNFNDKNAFKQFWAIDIPVQIINEVQLTGKEIIVYTGEK